jgi:hypothetical protein
LARSGDVALLPKNVGSARILPQLSPSPMRRWRH